MYHIIIINEKIWKVSKIIFFRCWLFLLSPDVVTTCTFPGGHIEDFDIFLKKFLLWSVHLFFDFLCNKTQSNRFSHLLRNFLWKVLFCVFLGQTTLTMFLLKRWYFLSVWPPFLVWILILQTKLHLLTLYWLTFTV